MNVKHLNQRQLADRWGVSEATLERWRSEGIGCVYLKLHGRVLYRLEDIEAYELKHLHRKPGESIPSAGADVHSHP